MLTELHHGDCLAVMPTFPAGRFQSVVTDPPYDLGFMGARWDQTGIAFRPETWAEVLRVTEPSAYLLAFGGTRTVHRMTVAIEDAGWVIRDVLVWAYAQGMPKSRSSLKPAWEPIVLARAPGPVRPLNIDETRIGTSKEVPASPSSHEQGRTYGPRTAGAGTPEGIDPNVGRWPPNVVLSDPIFDGGWEDVVGGGDQRGGGNPAWRSEEAAGASYGGYAGGNTGKVPVDTAGSYSRFFLIPKASSADREPVVPGQLKPVAIGPPGAKRHCRNCGSERLGEAGKHICRPDCSGKDLVLVKSARSARENTHTTVKPTELMRHLVRLVTPAGGTVLDPFLGSGTTALACEAEGLGWCGIEMEQEHVDIIRARLEGNQQGLGLG